MRPISAITLMLCLFMSPAWADEQADIEAVEKILKIEKEALEIRDRAGKRAKIAVNKSSLGKQCKQAKEAYEEANDNLKQSKAYREFLGSEKLTDEDRPYELDKMRKFHKEWSRRSDAYETAKKPVKRLHEIYSAISKRCYLMEEKVFLIFLDDEIDRAVEAKLKHLSRELKKIRKEYISA